MSWAVREARLALGLEARDAVLGDRVSRSLIVELELPSGERRALPRHESARYSLLLREIAGSPLDLRIYDHRRGYVPRRLRVALPPVSDASAGLRVRRPRMFPGVAWDLVGKATALRSRVLRDGAPVRWARVEARRPDEDEVVLRTQADDRGEFLLVLAPDSLILSELSPLPPAGGALISGLELDIRIYGPDEAPIRAANESDPLWDLPVDELPVLADPEDPDPGAAGELIPDDWIELTEQRIQLRLGRTLSDQSSFTL